MSKTTPAIRMTRPCFMAFLALMLCLSLCLAKAALAIEVVPQTADFYVNDAAGLLSPETKQYIIDVNRRLNEASGAQVVVVTMPDMGGVSLEEYATTLFNQYGIGDKQKNNGLLLLLALKERKFRIEVGYGLEGVLNDAKTGRIQDEYIIPHFKNGEWDVGIRNGFNALVQEIQKEYGTSVASEAPESVMDTLDAALGYGIFLCILVSWLIRRQKSLGKGLRYYCGGALLCLPMTIILGLEELETGIGYFIFGAFVTALCGFVNHRAFGNNSNSGSSSYSRDKRRYRGDSSCRSSFSSGGSRSYSGGGGRSGGGGSSRGF